MNAAADVPTNPPTAVPTDAPGTPVHHPVHQPLPQPPLAHVVDDDALSRKHLRTVLAFHGWRVQVSASAAQARTALRAEVPDVVLLDLQMPGENGYELLAWMRQQPELAQVPAICVTASVPPSERERVKAAGFAQFVPKPITPPQRLLDALHAVMGDRFSNALGKR